MNNRDPFRVRQISASNLTPLGFLRGGTQYAVQAVNEIQEKIEEYSARLLDDVSSISSQRALSPGMSGHVSSRHRTVVNSDDTFREETWQSSAPARTEVTHAGAVGEKLHDMFRSKDELPMYKDKPYNYTPSKRKGSLLKQKRLYLGVLGIIAFLFYWSGISSSIKTVADGLVKAGTTATTWDERRERVRDAFKLSWKAYEKHGWGYDEYYPVSQKGRMMVPNGMGWIIVDALDTMILMNLTSELTHARQWVAKDLHYDQDHDVNTFETTIRMLGGLLSAHYLSTKFPNMAPIISTGPNGDDLYLEKACDLADRLLGAYESKSGVPYASINLNTREGIVSHDDGGASSTAEATTLQLEMKYLSKLTGETTYWEASEKVMEVVDGNAPVDGLVPIFIYADSGEFRGQYIRLGSRGDSYYEYLIKQYLQTSLQEPVYKEMWDEALAGVKKHLVTYTAHDQLTIIAEKPSGVEGTLFPKMDHLVCFMPGTIALAATGGATLEAARRSPSWGAKNEEDMELARQLMKTCWAMYRVTQTGLAPEIAHFKVESPPPAYGEGGPAEPSADLDEGAGAAWRQDFDIHANDLHNLQRPETVESLFYMWRITGDAMYREWGWKMFQSFTQHTFAGEDKGFTSIHNVNAEQPSFRDNMESFWLAETLKYFYLLFGPNDILPLDQVVLNTEAHVFPRFELGKLFKTGWQRKPRAGGGNKSEQEKPANAPDEEQAEE